MQAKLLPRGLWLVLRRQPFAISLDYSGGGRREGEGGGRVGGLGKARGNGVRRDCARGCEGASKECHEEVEEKGRSEGGR